MNPIAPNDAPNKARANFLKTEQIIPTIIEQSHHQPKIVHFS